jgi:hypothetical protein
MPMISVANRPETVMDIRNVSNQGNVDRSSDRSKRAEGKRAETAPNVVRDEANISQGGRATAAAVDALAERARGDGSDRQALVANALRKLTSGELDGEESIEGAARRLRDSRFNSV